MAVNILPISSSILLLYGVGLSDTVGQLLKWWLGPKDTSWSVLYQIFIPTFFPLHVTNRSIPVSFTFSHQTLQKSLIYMTANVIKLCRNLTELCDE